MMIALGNFIFRWRNLLFPSAVVVGALATAPMIPGADERLARIGWAVALIGQVVRALAIGLVYIVRGGRGGRVYADGLVTGGMFAHCRNPLYLGNLLIVAGLALAANAWAFAAIVWPSFLLAYLAIIAAEEDYLGRKFGEGYAAYCRQVPRLSVRFRGLSATLRSHRFNWRRLLVKEYGTTAAWLLALTLLTARRQILTNGWEVARLQLNGWLITASVVVLGWGIARYLKKGVRIKAD